MRARLLSIALLFACGVDQAPTGPGSEPATAAAAAKTLVFTQIRSGYSFACGIATDGAAWCWGDNSGGQLGDGTIVNRVKPVRVAGGLRFRQIDLGVLATCGVTVDNKAYCWGTNETGLLGDGTTTDRLTPKAVVGGKKFSEVETGLQHTCGLSYPDNRAWCWGDNDEGELGDGTNRGPQHHELGFYSPTPVLVLGNHTFRDITAGSDFSCGVATDGRGYCWGRNRDGQLGDGSTRKRRTQPHLVAGTVRFASIDAGDGNACAIATDGRLFCWGGTPSLVPGNHAFASVSVGKTLTCGATTANKAYCWGGNQNGQLGDGTHTDRALPTAVKGGLAFGHVSAGAFHACGITTGGNGYCWGWNFFGQLGDGTNNDRSTPTPVSGGN